MDELKKAIAPLKVVMQTALEAHSGKNIAMEVFLNHYAELVEKLTGTPATETLTLLKDAMNKEHEEYLKKVNEALFDVINNTKYD